MSGHPVGIRQPIARCSNRSVAVAFHGIHARRREGASQRLNYCESPAFMPVIARGKNQSQRVGTATQRRLYRRQHERLEIGRGGERLFR